MFKVVTILALLLVACNSAEDDPAEPIAPTPMLPQPDAASPSRGVLSVTDAGAGILPDAADAADAAPEACTPKVFFCCDITTEIIQYKHCDPQFPTYAEYEGARTNCEEVRGGKNVPCL